MTRGIFAVGKLHISNVDAEGDADTVVVIYPTGSSAVTINTISVGSSNPRQLIYDGSTGESFVGYAIAEYNSQSIGSYDRSSLNAGANNGFRDFFGELFVGVGVTKANHLSFGTGIPAQWGTLGPMGWGNRYGGAYMQWDQYGQGGGLFELTATNDGGATFPTSILLMDTTNSGFGFVQPGILAFGDGFSTFWPHDATKPLLPLKFGNTISAGWFQWVQTGSSGFILELQYSSDAGVTWTSALTINASTGAVTIPGANPPAGAYDLPLYYDASGWHAFSIPGLLNFLSNSTSLNVGNAVGWDGSKLNNLTGLNLMTTLAGGASFSNAYSPTKWTGSALVQMSNADLGNFLGLGSSSTPMMMVYQGNTGAFTVQSIPAATTPANSTNIPYYNYGWLSYTPTSFLTNFLGVSVPSSEQMLTTNGAAYFTRPILPTPTTSTAPQIWNGSYWAGATPAQMTTALLGATPANNAVMRYQTSTGTLIGATAPSFTASVPTSHSTPGTPGSFASDSTSLYYWLTSTLVMRINASGNSITW